MFRYSESAAPPALRPWFHDVWEFAVTGEGAESHHVPPDGHTSIVVITAPWMPPQWVVSGPWIDPLVVPAHAGMVTRGLRLALGAVPGVLDTPADRWLNRSVALPPVPWLVPAVRNALQGAPTLNDAASIVWPVLQPATGEWPSPDSLVAAAAEAIQAAGGVLSLGALAAQHGVGASTLLRRMRTATGLTPKQFTRIVRFRVAALRLIDRGVTSGQAAAGGGYADQPHFTHEVRALTGLTPGDLASRIRHTEHRLDSA